MARLPKLAHAAACLMLAALSFYSAAARQSPDFIQPVVPKTFNLPSLITGREPFSTVLMAGESNSLNLLADHDGREDLTADRERDMATALGGDFLRCAFSAHSVANGFNGNVMYSYVSFSNALNLIILMDNDGDGSFFSVGDVVSNINLAGLIANGVANGVNLMNPIAGDALGSNSYVTGIAVNPVADLGDFGLCGQIGEVVYVSLVTDGGAIDETSSEPLRSRILAFGIADETNGVSVVSARQLLRHRLGHLAGVTVDDDGSLYFQLIDPERGGAIFKVKETPRSVCGQATQVNRVIASIPTGLDSGIETQSHVTLVSGGYRLTNFSGLSPTFGNIVALAAAPHNTIYAAMARSRVPTDSEGLLMTQGPFTNPTALGATPAMVIGFTDVTGAYDSCNVPAPGYAGAIPGPDGFADVARAGAARVQGVNNFKAFVLGDGPDRRTSADATRRAIFGNTSETLKLRMQIDYTTRSGLAVDENFNLYVISGAQGADGVTNPSPDLGEILAFTDEWPRDLRADYIDLRGDQPPILPASGGNIGDGDSDRFDHIFAQARIDAQTTQPRNLSGLAVGHLRYLNRNGTNVIANLPNSETQGDDDADGPILFDAFDPSFNVAGGDDSVTSSTGDDSGSTGNPAPAGGRAGGFEFRFGSPGSCDAGTWNGFYLNSNGNLTFGAGSNDNRPTIPNFRSGPARIAPMWVDLNSAARQVNRSTFPVQALGFAGVNAFKVRYINVPQFGEEACAGFSNATQTFSVTLFDDGTGEDENEPGQEEGPADLRWIKDGATGMLIGQPPRRPGGGEFCFDYGHCTQLGTPSEAALVGYSIGGQSPVNPPGLCETNLGLAALVADASPFQRGLIGSGTESHIYELFNEGRKASTTPEGYVITAVPDWDLRHEGADSLLGTPIAQVDPNRAHLRFIGSACTPPLQPRLQSFKTVPPVVVAPGQPAITSVTVGLLNALGSIDVILPGVDFLANQESIICQGVDSSPGLPVERAGRTVTTSVTLEIDENNDLNPEAALALSHVELVSGNMIRARLSALANAPGTAFPAGVRGGKGKLKVLTTITGGDDNVYGPLPLSTEVQFNLGNRAPVVETISPAFGLADNDLNVQIEGDGFILPGGAANVTQLYAELVDDPSIRVNATNLNVTSSTQMTAQFRFNAIFRGKQFMIYASGPSGVSRNLRSLPAGASAAVPLGNEYGFQVLFSVLLKNATEGWAGYE